MFTHPNNKIATLLISFSGGRTSAFMTKFILEHPKYKHFKKVIVFANTGKEREETLDFINECDIRWDLNVVWIEPVVNPQMGVGTSFRVVNYETANRDGQPFETAISKYGIPNIARPYCTRELKLVPIKKYMQSLGLKKWVSAIGIRYDERHRINPVTSRKENKIYPLAQDLKCNKTFIRNWWKNQDFDLKLKDYEGNCDLCYKKSERKLLTIAKEQPQLVEWWDHMETKYEGGEYSFFRNHTTAKELAKKAYSTDFIEATDEFNDLPFNPILDMEFDCMCKAS
ncbi:phosphoadenosine phosphosulfate reductase family protein [Aquimarina algiphila]|nr:phosphoadenosine phosphosulfate reductase family protein [Aquimarina algiphila]